MKKTFKLAAIAAIASLALVACNNNKAAEEEVDSTAIEQIAEEVAPVADEIADTVAAVAETPAPAPAKKTPAKKAEPKDEGMKIQVNTTTTSTEIKVDPNKADDVKVSTTRKRR